MRRRRFLQIVAAAALAPVQAFARDRRIALGAEAELTLYGPPDLTARAQARAWAELDRIESVFSLYCEDSALSRLNATGRLDAPPPELLDVLALSARLHEATEGRFDPTVQPLWLALANGADPEPARRLIGWDGVTITEAAITLRPGQALTLNGIAQGYATDRVTQVLAEEGLTHALVDIGEFRALEGPFHLGVEDPAFGRLGQITLNGAAAATSSPGAMILPDGSGHILDPHGGAPAWSTVTVTAPTAALADGLATALCLADAEAARRILAALGPGLRATAVTRDGDLLTL
ncbi:Nitrous oxide reductase maturation periplasmic protein NosX [Rubellimicrobium mesophilum DSM 19309]|uniref:FAD:protein FMN transferase n=1 Tax=Rubellimicrobium mesophilum DSM 19309 TaxID=442562 RepID=A0A017HL66_9RHOB|nr:FAD:protein FMN transferase [Rubellimicrobium mesophilum]EYD74923.1 Nitrous oxide reductase maturation periplasmic protein NosX [Rubellimicrobium mesophilum DSM 19309]